MTLEANPSSANGKHLQAKAADEGKEDDRELKSTEIPIDVMTGNAKTVETTAVRPLGDDYSYVNPSYVSDSQEDVRINLEKTPNNQVCVQAYPETTKSSPEDVSSANNTCILDVFPRIQKGLVHFWEKHRRPITRLFLLLLFVLYNVYFGLAIKFSWHKTNSWCEGIKFLTIITVCVYASVFYYFVVKRYLGKRIAKTVGRPLRIWSNFVCGKRYCGILSLLVVLGAMLIFVMVDSKMKQDRLLSFGGLCSLLVLGFIFSKHPSKVIFKHVTWGIGLQFVFALLILRWETGREIFQCVADKVASFLAFSDYGANFMFSYLSSGQLMSGNATMAALAHGNQTTYSVTAINFAIPSQISVFAFKVLPVIFFFSFCVAILYYYGIMQWVVMKVGWLLQVSVGTTAAESMNAAANIFMGQTEAPLLIRPYLPLMTKSELHAIMTGGFATIAGAVMAAYISLGVSPSHLLSASVMSAPAALAFSKLFYPESEVSQTTAAKIKIEKGTEKNALEAGAVGVTMAVTLVANIAANLIAFIAFIYFVDHLTMWFGALVGWEISLTYLMSLVFMPVAYMMGVPWNDCQAVGELIGLKTVINEFVAYDKLGKIKDDLSLRSQTIATYALCGFSNLSSIGIQLGGLGAMAPGRMADLAEVAMRAMIAGSAACFLTACIAGCLLTEEMYTGVS